MTDPITLYDSPGSPCARRVRAVLLEKGLVWATRLPRDAWARARAKMWQPFELAMAKDFRPLMYARGIGPYDRLRPREEVLADARRATDDPAHLDWVGRVYDGEVVPDAEAPHLESLLVQRLDRLEAALEPARHPRVCDWLARPSFARSETVQPA
jgi:hypothetical protein